jgi:hypothetical protein
VCAQADGYVDVYNRERANYGYARRAARPTKLSSMGAQTLLRRD